MQGLCWLAWLIAENQDRQPSVFYLNSGLNLAICVSRYVDEFKVHFEGSSYGKTFKDG